MSCSNCGNNQNPYAVYNVQYIYKNDCADCANSGCDQTLKAGCVFYTSANLPISGILTNDSLEVALQKIEVVLAAVAGDYSGYNINCLGAAGSITTEAQFVNAITAAHCALDTAVDTFIGTTFVAYQATVDTRFDAIEVPGITCAAASVLNTDTLQQVLTKYCTKFGAINTALDISAVDWDQCFTVLSPPTTIAEGFDLLIDQICQLSGGFPESLPTFNNIGSCLTAPGATDSLEDTVIKIRDYACALPTLDNDDLVSTCISVPGTANDLQTLMQNILTKLDAISQSFPTFDESDFAVTMVDPEDACAGLGIALQTPINVDRYVAVDGSDLSPGTLVNKLEAGTNVTFDIVSTPGKLIINASGGGSDSFTVKASSLGVAAGFLDAKIGGETNDAITISTFFDAGDDKLIISPSVDTEQLIDNILTLIENDVVIKARLCAIIATCPTPCSAPQNVQVVVVPAP
jgi:hypothetical protein